jgi:hypothetical protein
MGGRGRSSGLGKRQYSTDDEFMRKEISGIIDDSKRIREALIGKAGISSGSGLPQLLKKCACCGEYTIPARTTYELCSNCGWIDDPHQNHNPESLNGKNTVSLTQARKNYIKKTKKI